MSVTAWRVGRSELFWQNPIASGRFEHLADFDGIEQAAALSRDGRFVAFLSDRDGPMDVWRTQVGTGQFVNLTRGRFQELINPMVRTLGFSPDGSLVTFWTRKPDGPSPNNISVWAVPILGGQPRPYLEGVSEFDWSNDAARLVYHSSLPGDPTFVRERAIAPDGQRIAFSIDQGARTRLYVMQADGTDARVVTEALHLKGAPTWAPDGQSITTAAVHGDSPRLFQISLDGRPPILLLQDYAVDPVWDPEGRFVVYSGADLGTRFALKAVTASGGPYALPDLTMTRGARRVCFLPGRRGLVVLRGEIQHKDLWLIDLETAKERQLTKLASDFDVRDFDVSPDGNEIVLDRVQELSDIVLIDLPSDN